MLLEEVVRKLNLKVLAPSLSLHREIAGAYVSDLLSDVMANSKDGELWLTLQIHPNIVAVATLKNLAGIILVHDRQPEAETLKKAEEERIPILSTDLPTFQLAGKLYKLFENAEGIQS